MGDPVGLVQNRVQIDGVDNASDAIRKVQNSLKGLDETTGGLGSRFHEAGEASAAAMSRVGGLARPLAGFMGDASAETRELGHGLHGVGLAMELLPGPIGLAVGALAAATGGAYLLYKHLEKVAAARRRLDTPQSMALEESLDLEAEGARKVSEALEGLAEGTRPNNELIKQVVANAKALGEDPVKAVEDFAKAWGTSAAAVIAYENAHGRLAGLDRDALSEMATRLGLNKEDLGLETKRGDVKATLNQQALQAAELEAQLRADEFAQDKLFETGRKAASQDARDAANLAANHMIDKIAGEKAAAAAAGLLAQHTQKTLESERAIAAEDKSRAVHIQTLEATAEMARTKALSTGIKLQAIAEQQAAVSAKLAALDEIRAVANGALTAEQQSQLALLKLQLLQLDGKQKGLIDADHAAQKTKAHEAIARLEAESQATLALAKARATASAQTTLGGGANDQKAAAAAEAAEQIKSVQRSEASARAKKTKIETIKQDLANKVAEIDKKASDEETRLADENLRILDDNDKRETDQKLRSTAAQIKSSDMRAKGIAQVLREQGKEEEAILVERRQANADYQSELTRIDLELHAERVKAKDDAMALADAEAEADYKRLEAREQLAQRERQIEDQLKQQRQASIAEAVSAVDTAAQFLQTLGTGTSFVANGIGRSLGAMSKGFGELGKALDSEEHKAANATKAIAGTVGAMATAMIDADTKRTTTQLDMDEQRALSTATTEQQKAQITERFEKAKADAVDAGQRKSAAIMGAMAAAQAIAYAFTPMMQWAAVGQGVASAAFFAIAGGAGGSSYVPGAATAGSGGFNSATGGASGGSSATGGGVTNVFNFNQPLSTAQHIGKAVNAAQASLSGTGIPARKGA